MTWFFIVLDDKDCFQQEWKEKTQCFPQSIEFDKHIHPTKHIHHKKEPKKTDSELFIYNSIYKFKYAKISKTFRTFWTNSFGNVLTLEIGRGFVHIY